MNGRILNEIKINEATVRILEDLPEYVKEWYVNLKASGLTAATIREYIRKVRFFLSTIDTDTKHVNVNQITEYNVSEFFASLAVKDGSQMTSDSYRASTWACLNNFLGYLHRKRLIDENYMQLIKKPCVKDLDRINESRVRLTGNDFKKLLDKVRENDNEVFQIRDEAILKLFMYTGMRKSALINIMMDDVDMNASTLVVIDKGKKRHQYVLNNDLKNTLSDWISVRSDFANKRGDKHFFLSDRGIRMSETAVYTVVTKYTQAALGKALSPHKLRAGFCSILYEQTGDIEFVRRAVGHSSASTTQRYIVTKGDERRRASEIINNLI